MAATETLRPTVATEKDATLTNGANAFDGSVGTYATIAENTEGQKAAVQFDTFPAGAISPTKRASVTLEIYGTWGTTDPNDKATIWVRPKTGDPWTAVQTDTPPTGWVAGFRAFDITDVVGTEPLSSLEVQAVFANYGTGGGDPPLPV